MVNLIRVGIYANFYFEVIHLIPNFIYKHDYLKATKEAEKTFFCFLNFLYFI